MSVRRIVGTQLERVKDVADQFRVTCGHAVEAALSAGKSGYAELVKTKEELEPRVRAAVDEGIKTAQRLLDEFNQALAEQAIPTFRKASVTQKRLEEKSSHAKQRISSKGFEPSVVGERAAPRSAASKAARKTVKAASKTKAQTAKSSGSPAPATGKKSQSAGAEKAAPASATKGKT